jgi:hypothetical protein
VDASPLPVVAPEVAECVAVATAQALKLGEDGLDVGAVVVSLHDVEVDVDSAEAGIAAAIEDALDLIAEVFFGVAQVAAELTQRPAVLTFATVELVVTEVIELGGDLAGGFVESLEEEALARFGHRQGVIVDHRTAPD